MGKFLLLLGLLVVGFVATIALASELGGEVVTLTTEDADGAERSTSLWVVDHGGSPYLRAGDKESSWYQRLVAQPRVRVERGGTEQVYTAEPAPDLTPAIDQMMAEKYGWADRLVGLIRRSENSMAVRLAPAS